MLVQETLRRGLSGRHVQRGERQSDPGRGGSGEDRQGVFTDKRVFSLLNRTPLDNGAQP